MKKAIFVVLLANVVLYWRPVDARVWRTNVDGTGDAPAIQAAIDSASDGDEVHVGPGIFHVNLNLRGKAIHLLGSGSGITVLDGSEGDSSVIVCNSGENNATVIEGFTIMNGKGTPLSSTSRFGGGILCLDSAPSIIGNVISGNNVLSPAGVIHGASAGGGFFLNGSSSDEIIVRNNLIEDNLAQANGGGGWIASSAIFDGNIVRGNHTMFGDAGGLYVRCDRVQILNNEISANVAADKGGGIHVAGCGGQPQNIEIAGNIIIGNEANAEAGSPDCTGGGLNITGGAYVHHNTIIFNKGVSNLTMGGGGLCLTDTFNGTSIEANLIYHNQNGGVTFSLTPTYSGEASVIRNLIFENGGTEIGDPEGFHLYSIDNVFEDPLLCTKGLGSNGEVAGVSPALNQPWGIIGAAPIPGCGPYVGTQGKRTTWGSIKSLYKGKSRTH